MILVIGGAFQGKKDYVKKQFALAEEDFADGARLREGRTVLGEGRPPFP